MGCLVGVGFAPDSDHCHQRGLGRVRRVRIYPQLYSSVGQLDAATVARRPLSAPGPVMVEVLQYRPPGG